VDCDDPDCNGAPICQGDDDDSVGDDDDDDDSTPATCEDDALEEDDTAFAATAVTLPAAETALTSCSGDDDWFTFSALQGDEVTISLSFPHAEGNIDATAYNDTGGVVAQGFSSTDDEALVFVVGSTGVHALAVTLAQDLGPAPGNAYDVAISSAPTAASCLEDGFEENDDLGSAAPLTSPVAETALAVCPDDSDWFTLDLFAGEEVDVALTFSHAEGDLDLALLDASGNVVAESVTQSDDEALNAVIGATGAYFVRVLLSSDSGVVAGNSYDLDLTSTPPATCQEDTLEENDELLTATATSPGLQSLLQACDGDADWFEIALASSDELTVEAGFDHGEGDIDLELFDASGNPLTSSTSQSDDEVVSYTSAAAELVYAVVTLVADTGSFPGNAYDLDVSVINGVTCPEDGEEENDDQASAAIVGDGILAGLQACPADVDWFAADLTIGNAITATASPAPGEGTLSLELYDPSGTLLETGTNLSGGVEATAGAAVDGLHAIRVELVTDAGPGVGAAYDLDVELIFTSTCTDDALEENDGALSATPLAGSFADPTLAACPGDSDWFAWSLAAGDTLDVTLTFDHAGGDIDAELLDANGSTVDIANSTSDDEVLTFTAQSAGTASLQVFLQNDQGAFPGNPYELDVVHTPGSAGCIDDSAEENDSFPNPSTLTTGNTPGLVACPFDADVWSFFADPGDTVQVDAGFLHSDGDIDLELYDSTGTLVDSATSNSDDETVTDVASAFGPYIVVVNLDNDAGPNPGNAYDLTLTLVPTSSGCVDDAFEDNDAFPDASQVAHGGYPANMACPLDPDYFTVDVAAGQDITVSLDFDHAEGDIDLALYDNAGNLLADSITQTDDESLTYTAPQQAFVFIEVTLTADSGIVDGSPYDLDLLVGSTGLPCTDDGFEDNDNVTSPSSLSAGTTSNLTVCPADEDWWEFPAAVGQLLTVEALFDNSDGDIDLEFMDFQGNVLDVSTSNTDNEVVTATATGSGSHFVRVYLLNDAGPNGGNDYDLELTFGTSNCIDDGFEDNDTVAATTELPLGATTGLQSCPGDPDWYYVLAGGGETLTFDATFTHAEGDLNLTLMDFNGNHLGSSNSTSDNESVTGTATAQGPMILSVILASDAGNVPGNPYDLTITSVTVGPNCTDDALEENDSPPSAVLVSQGTQSLTTCPFDEDWFYVSVPGAGTLTVDLAFAHADGDINIEIIDPTTQQAVADSLSTTDNESVSVVFATASNPVVRVWLDGETDATPGADYDLTVAIH